MDEKSSEKSALLTSASEKVGTCVACDVEPPEGRILLVWEVPMCGRCSVVARRTLSSDATLNPRLARLFARILAGKGIRLASAADLVDGLKAARTPFRTNNGH